MRNRRQLVVPVGIAIFAAIVLCGCGSKSTANAEVNPVRNPLEIAPSADLQKQIKTGRPRWETVTSTLRVAGRVEADGTRMARVSAPVTGRLVEMNAYEGQQVRKGEVLATVYSTELSAAETDFLKANSQRQMADRAMTRAKLLLDAGVIGSAELQRREAELQQAAADVAAARERLRVLGVSEETVATLQNTRRLVSLTHIPSTIDGVVLERKATIGQIVQAAEPVFTIADLSHVWLVADVPEQSAGSLGVGKAVEAEIPALPGHKIRGLLSFVSATVDPQTRTVGTRMNLANPQRLYKPSMLTTMTLMDQTERRLVIPSSAVVREGNSNCVFVETQPNTYELHAVDVGDEADGKRVLLEGASDQDRIVIEGAFHLNNERKRQALGGGEGS